jgi:hypothetical protein
MFREPCEARASRGVSPGSSVVAGAEGRAEVPPWTSGRESWVFRAERPDELCGHHADLIGSALAPDELLHYLLYAPIFDAKDGPFRVGGEPGSHAVALTSRRLLVSRDAHAGASRLSLTSIDLETVSCLEIGSALAMGWLVVRYAAAGGAASRPIIFNGHGMEHFRAVVRGYLLGGRAARAPSGTHLGSVMTALDWSRVWDEVPACLRTELQPLVAGDRPLAALRAPERWTLERRGWRRKPVCSSAPGLLVATPLGLLWAVSERRASPGGLAFGVQVTAVRAEGVREAGIGACGDRGALRVLAGDGPHPHQMEVLFDGGDVARAEEIVHLARAWRGLA